MLKNELLENQGLYNFAAECLTQKPITMKRCTSRNLIFHFMLGGAIGSMPISVSALPIEQQSAQVTVDPKEKNPFEYNFNYKI